MEEHHQSEAQAVEPILTDHTPFNPFGPDQQQLSGPTYRALLVTLAVVLIVTAAFFCVLQLSR